MINRVPDSVKSLIQSLGDQNPKVRAEAGEMFAQAVREPIREAVFDCDVAMDIFVPTEFDRNCPIKYQLDIIQPGKEKDYKAFAIPQCTSMPRCFVESDAVMLPTYRIGNCFDWCDDHARDSHYNMFAQIVKYFRRGFVKKINDDAWRLLIAAALDRNAIVFDDQAAPGQFTKRLLSLMKLVMKRNNGGNGGDCEKPCRLTDLYVSCEAMEDMMNWGIDQVSDDVRTRIFNTCDGLTEIFCVKLHDMTELGIDQEYQLMYENELNGPLPGADPDDGSGLAAAKREIVVGLCLNNRADTFVMPVRDELSTVSYQCVQEGTSGIRGSMEFGLGVLDGRALILGSF